MIVVLSLEPPGGPRAALRPSGGALIATTDHPERRQFLIQAALRRADELSRLRELPVTLARTAVDVKLAGLPANRLDSDPDNATATVSKMPGVTLPVDIGESSTFELPIAVPEERPPVIQAPQHKGQSDSRRKTPHRARHVRAKTPPPAQPDALATLFGAPQRNQPPATPPAPH